MPQDRSAGSTRWRWFGQQVTKMHVCFAGNFAQFWQPWSSSTKAGNGSKKNLSWGACGQSEMKQSCLSVPNISEVHRHALLSWHGTDSIAFSKSVIPVAHDWYVSEKCIVYFVVIYKGFDQISGKKKRIFWYSLKLSSTPWSGETDSYVRCCVTANKKPQKTPLMSFSSRLVLIWVMMLGLIRALTECTHTLHL